MANTDPAIRKISMNFLRFSSSIRAKIENYLVEKMSVYLAKMSTHDYILSQKKPSQIAIGSIYVSLKICEQLKKKEFIN